MQLATNFHTQGIISGRCMIPVTYMYLLDMSLDLTLGSGIIMVMTDV